MTTSTTVKILDNNVIKDGPVKFQPATPILEERFRAAYPDLIERVCRHMGSIQYHYSKDSKRFMAQAKRFNNIILFTLVKKDNSGLINAYIKL